MSRKRRSEDLRERRSAGARDEEADAEAAANVFFSYRRQDSPEYASRLHDDLAARFGAGGVFVDIDTVSPGQDFLHAVRSAIRNADAVIAMIGPDWLDARDQSGNRRLSDPQDVVRFELRCAIYDRKLIIPVLVGGAEMVRADELPADLSPLATRNAIAIGDATWPADSAKLMEGLASHRPGHPARAVGIQPPAKRTAAHSTVERTPKSRRRRRLVRSLLYTILSLVAIAVPVALIVVLTVNSSPGASGGAPELTGALLVERFSTDNDSASIYRMRADTGLLDEAVYNDVRSSASSPVWLGPDRAAWVRSAEGLGYFAVATGSALGPVSSNLPFDPHTQLGASVLRYVRAKAACPFRGWLAGATVSITIPVKDGYPFALATFEVGPQPSGAHRILLPDTTSVEPLEVVWSPDGSRALVTAATADGGYAIYLVDAGGSKLTRLVGGWSPAWSPDGRSVAFVAPDDSGIDSLWIVPAGGSTAEQPVTTPSETFTAPARWLTSGVRVSGPTWSPDGRSIAFAERIGVQWRIYAVNADGGVPVPVGDEAAGIDDLCPAWGKEQQGG